MSKPFGAIELVMARAFWFEGKNGYDAAVEAGYDPAYAIKRWQKILKSEEVKQALLLYASNIKPQEIGKLADAQLHKKLVDLPKDPRTALGYIRTGYERANLIGGPAELHLHDHTISPAAAEMIAQKVLELQRKEGAIDGTIVSEGAASEGQDQENHDGIQIGELAHGFQDRTIG